MKSAQELTEIAEAVMAHAGEHYEQGWDVIVECWSIAELAKAIANMETMDLETALKHFASVCGIFHERAMEAQAAGGVIEHYGTYVDGHPMKQEDQGQNPYGSLESQALHFSVMSRYE